MDEDKVVYAQKTEQRTLAEVMKGADIFLGLSAAGVLKPEMVATMRANPVIFALANPTPEILPEEVHAMRFFFAVLARLKIGRIVVPEA